MSIASPPDLQEVVAEGELAHHRDAVGRPVPHRHRHPLARGHFGPEEAIGLAGATVAARSRPWPAGKRPGMVTGSFPPIGASPQSARDRRRLRRVAELVGQQHAPGTFGAMSPT